MSRFFWAIAFVVAVVNLSESKNKNDNKKCRKTISKFQACLQGGFKSKLRCEVKKGSLTKKALKSCKKLEKKVRKCNYSCEEKEGSDSKEPKENSGSKTKTGGCPLLGIEEPCPESIFFVLFGR